MKSTAFLITLALLGVTSGARAAQPARVSRTSMQYHTAREAITQPSESLTKVRGLIRRLKADSALNARLSAKAFNALSYPEKFTYVMIHGEDFSQNCDVNLGIHQEERKIFAYFPGPFSSEMLWSDQQLAFLKQNRPRVIASLRQLIRNRRRVGANVKGAVEELDAVELVPDLVAAYNRTRTDHDLLTVLMILMKEKKYRPFISTPEYRKLFDENAAYDAFLPATAANQRFIIGHAQQFYQSSRK